MSDLVPRDPAEVAFEGLRSEVALLRRALESLAAEPTPADYSAALEKIAAEIGDLADQVTELTSRPRPSEAQFREVAAAVGSESVREPREALWKAIAQVNGLAGELSAIVEPLRRRRLQAWRLAIVAASASVSAVAIWTSFAGPVARVAPSKWAWSEKMAAASLGMPMWQAGAQLMSRADPRRLDRMRRGEELLAANEAAVAECQQRARGKGAQVRCGLKVGPG